MTGLTVLAALLILEPQSPDATEPVTIRLTAYPKKGAGELRYEGKALFPDGIALRGTLYKLEERLKEGILAVEPTEISNDTQGVEGKRVGYTFTVRDPGLYRLVVEYREDLQEPDLLAAFKKSTPGKWTFDHAVWGDDFVLPLGGKLRDFDQHVETALSLVRRFARATASNVTWKDQYPGLDKELTGVLKKFDQSGLDRAYPAAALELRSTLRNLKGNAEAILFDDEGKCRGSIDYRTKKPTKTIHSEDFTFDAVIRDVEKAGKAVGREFLLWILKDVRRSGARTALSDAIRSEARRPGVAPYVEALEGFKDADAIEKLIRDGACPK
jgi:hypothetical protein